MEKILLTFDQVWEMVKDLVHTQVPYPPDVIVGVSRGGIYPAIRVQSLLSSITGKRFDFKVVDPFTTKWMDEFKDEAILVIDDIWDSGATLQFIQDEATKRKLNLKAYALFVKTPEDKAKDVWYQFPWETDSDEAGGRKQATITLLRSIGEDPMREGLRDTPRRIDKMWNELTSGYRQDPEAILGTAFSTESYDEMIMLRDIHFYSMCEHHMLPFYGVVHFAYIPDKRIVGVSKIARLVDCFSRRLQIQERMTMQIGREFEKIVSPLGVGVVVEGVHLCMMIRGVEKENVKMLTNYLGGSFREAAVKSEFLGRLGSK